MSDPAERKFVDVFSDYQRALQRANAFDFDDLIGQTVYLFRAFPHVADVYRRRFRHILVDEYQDTNHAQYALIHELTRPIGSDAPPIASSGGMMIFEADPADDPDKAPASLTVVGDSDQSIYAFRGADIRNITEFERDYPGAKVVLLEQNYRSTQNILSAANAVIGNNFDRKDKKLWTDVGAGEKIVGFTGYSQHDEAQFVADEVETLRRGGIDYSQMAVFYRTNSQSPRAGGDLHPLRRAVQDHGRHEVLRACRDQGRAGVPGRRVESGRRDGDAPHHQQAAPRNRRRHDRDDLALRRERADHVPRCARQLLGARCRTQDPGGDRAPGRRAGRGIRTHAALDGRARTAHGRRRGTAAAARQDRATPTRCGPAATRRTRPASRTSTSSSPSRGSSRATTRRVRSSTSSPRSRWSRTPTTSRTRRARCRS